MTFTDLPEAMAWFDRQSNPTPRWGLEPIQAGLAYLGHPEKDLPVVHLAGTNGKGSTSQFLNQLCLSQGLQVASYTSPHIRRFNERFVVDGQEISDGDLLDLINQMVEVNAYLEAQGYSPLAYFELTTLMGALYFQAQAPDVCIIEAGIGGRHDSTAAFDNQLALITTVAFDHEDRLGHSLEEIAYQKAGIIKPGSQVLLGDLPPEALTVVQEEARLYGNALGRYGQDFQVTDLTRLEPGGTGFTFRYPAYGVQESFSLSMLGDHQVHNAGLALAALVHWMDQAGQAIQWPAARQALAETQWPGRMEKVHSQPDIYLDGAHNPEGLQALSQTLGRAIQGSPLLVMYSGLTRKNQRAQVPLLADFPVDQVILTQFAYEGSMQASDLQPQLTGDLDYRWEPDWPDFIDDFIAHASPHASLVVTGSFYFISYVRDHILARQESL